MKRTGIKCSDCGEKLKLIHRDGHPPYKCCVSKICKDEYVVRAVPTGLAPPYPNMRQD